MIAEQPTRETLIDRYGHLCVRAARKFIRPGLDRADLQQTATIGLLKACDRYDPVTATPFEAFAWLFIIGELMHYVRDHERMVRPPRKLRRLEKQVHAAQEVLTCALEREPSTPELAQHLGVSAREIVDVYAYRNRAVATSLDSLHPHELGATTYTTDSPEEALLVQQALAQLNPTERQVVVALYSGGYSQLELATYFGYSRRHISRLHRRALKKMRLAVAV